MNKEVSPHYSKNSNTKKLSSDVLHHWTILPMANVQKSLLPWHHTWKNSMKSMGSVFMLMFLGMFVGAWWAIWVSRLFLCLGSILMVSLLFLDILSLKRRIRKRYIEFWGLISCSMENSKKQKPSLSLIIRRKG